MRLNCRGSPSVRMDNFNFLFPRGALSVTYQPFDISGLLILLNPNKLKIKLGSASDAGPSLIAVPMETLHWNKGQLSGFRVVSGIIVASIRFALLVSEVTACVALLYLKWGLKRFEKKISLASAAPQG